MAAARKSRQAAAAAKSPRRHRWAGSRPPEPPPPKGGRKSWSTPHPAAVANGQPPKNADGKRDPVTNASSHELSTPATRKIVPPTPAGPRRQHRQTAPPPRPTAAAARHHQPSRAPSPGQRQQPPAYGVESHPHPKQRWLADNATCRPTRVPAASAAGPPSPAAVRRQRCQDQPSPHTRQQPPGGIAKRERVNRAGDEWHAPAAASSRQPPTTAATTTHSHAVRSSASRQSRR